jgi:hypothetical protein
MLGFTSYLASWVWWMPITRVFAFPYAFAGALFAALVLWWAPRRFGSRVVPWAWGLVAVALISSQLAWAPIVEVFGPSELDWRQVKAERIEPGEWYGARQGHAIAVPDDRPDITYALARFGGVEGKHLVSEMYDPFAYLASDYRYEDHQSTVSTLIRCWLSESDVTLIAVPDTDVYLKRVVELNPTWFTHVGYMAEAKWDVESVSIPTPTSVECEAARSASR